VILPKPSPTEKSPVRKTVYNALGQVIQEINLLGNQGCLVSQAN
jgi:hypothetical protein